MLVLVLEASTTSAKAMVFSDDGRIVRLEIEPFSRDINAVTDQDVQGVYERLLAMGKRAAEGLDIAAIGLVGIWHSIQILRNHQPLGRALTWANTRHTKTASLCRSDRNLAKILHQKTGCFPHASYPAYKLTSLHYHRKQIDTERLDRQDPVYLAALSSNQLTFCGISDYVFWQLTGEFATSYNMASGMGLLNNQTRDWDSYMLAQSGLTPQQLPRLEHHSGHFPLMPSAATELGVAAGIPVALPFSDGCMNQLGAQAFYPGILTLSVGTSCAIRTVTDHIPDVELEAGLWCYQGLDNYLVGAATSGGTNCIDWFKNLFSPEESLQSLDQKASKVRSSLVFLPFVFGERSPGWSAQRKGGFFYRGKFYSADALKDSELRQRLIGEHGIPKLYRAVLEGILFAVLQSYEQLIKHVYLHTINISGGILYSPVWRQMAADILQRDLLMPSSEQASTLGGARMALFSADSEKFPLSLVSEQKGEQILADQKKAEIYQKHYADYLRAYVATTPVN